MKKRWIVLGTMFLLSGLGTAACSSDGPNPGSEPDPEPGVEVEDSAIEAYFAKRLKGQAATYDASKTLSPDEVAAEAERVWSLWSKAVKADDPALPAPSAHDEVEYWDYVATPDGAWTLPDGKMNFLYASKGSRPAAGYPLFIYLHGSGEAQSEWETGLAWCQYFSDAPSVYFVPRSPKGGTSCRWFPPSRQEAWERVIRQGFVSGDIDPERIYFVGISEGGYGSQRLASYYADYLAGAGPIAGGEQLFQAPPENCANIAFCLQTGEQDTMYGRSRLVRKAAGKWAALQQAHPGLYVHKIDLQPGKGHGCDYTVTTPWLKSHVRRAVPKYVYWENYAMGDALGEKARYRDCFYNLVVLEPSDDRTDNMVRSCYEMTVGDDNEIDLRVRVATLTETETVSEDGWTMTTDVEKSYADAVKGRVKIYLDERLVDLSKPVRVRVNGAVRYEGMAETTLGDLVESCALYFDPLRLFPASVEVDVR